MKNIIGIFGDSFADPTSLSGDTSWIKYLRSDPNIHVTCYGQSGTSLWWSFERFLKHYKKYDTIIFVYADRSRIHHLPEEYVGQHFKKPDFNYSNDNSVLEQKGIIEHYWKYFHNPKLDKFIFQKIFEEVNLRCKDRGIKLINVFSVPSLTDVDLRESSGTCFNNLLVISQNELNVFCKDADTPVDLGMDIDTRPCHLSEENNSILASIFLEVLHANAPASKKLVDLSADPRFIYDIEISRRYFYKA